MNPFELIQVITSVPCKVESIDIWGNNIYLGTNDGQILLYIIEKVESSTKKVSFKSRMEKKRSLGYGKKPVEKVLLISDIGKLLTLCDGNLDVFNLYNLEPTTPIPINKGITSFCLKKKSQDYRLCVMIKKKLCFFEYVRVFEQYKEIVLNDIPLTLEWCKNTIMLGYRREYVVLDLDTESSRVLFPLDKSQPKIKLLDDLDKFMVATEDIAVFVNMVGEPVQGTVHWNAPPSPQMAYVSPYLVSIVPGKSVDVHDMTSPYNKLVQSVPSMGGAVALTEGRGGGRDFIMLATTTTVSCLHVGNIDLLVQDLISRGEHQDAIRLFEIAFKRERAFDDSYDPAKEKAIYKVRLAKIHEQCGMNELYQMKFDSAFSYFEKSLVDPRALVSLYTGLLPYQTSFRSTGSQSSPSAAASTGSPSLGGGDVSFQELIDANVDVEDRAERMREAKLFLMNYLEKCWPQLKGADEQKDISTVLIKLYAELNEQSKAISHMSKNHSFYLQDLEEWLTKGGYYSTLGYVYQYGEKYRKALLIWSKLSNGELKDKYESDGIQESIDLLSTTILNQHQQAIINQNNQNNNNNNIFSNLQQQQQTLNNNNTSNNIEPPKELIWEFAPFLFKKQPTRAIKIFLIKRKDKLDSDEVIDFLQPYGLDMYQTYLEYLIFEEGNRNEIYHTKLASSYIDSVQVTSPEFFPPNQNRPPNAQKLTEERARLVALLEFSNCYNVANLLSKIKSSLLYEELVILYLRIGQYELMFDIIVWRLNDLKKAEMICESFDPKHSLSIMSSASPTVSPIVASPNLTRLMGGKSGSHASFDLSSSPGNSTHSPRPSHRMSMTLVPLDQQSSSPSSASHLVSDNISESGSSSTGGGGGGNLPNINLSSSSQGLIPISSNRSGLYEPKRMELFLCLLKTYLSKSSKQLINNFNLSTKPQQTQQQPTLNNNNNNNNNQNNIVELPTYLIEFLNNYYHEMDPIKVLQLLPPNTYLQPLEKYLLMSFNHSISHQRESKIVKNLHKSQNLKVKYEHQVVCSNSVHIGYNKVCPVCSKAIGDRIFAYFPNGTVVHFKCLQSSHICPLTAHNFKLDPVNPVSVLD